MQSPVRSEMTIVVAIDRTNVRPTSLGHRRSKPKPTFEPVSANRQLSADRGSGRKAQVLIFLLMDIRSKRCRESSKNVIS